MSAVAGQCVWAHEYSMYIQPALLATIFPIIWLDSECAGRFLVHRYSVLQQHVEDNSAGDVMDEPLETNHTPNGKIEFHDDSDEVWQICFFHHTNRNMSSRHKWSFFYFIKMKIYIMNSSLQMKVIFSKADMIFWWDSLFNLKNIKEVMHGLPHWLIFNLVFCI